MPRPRNEPRETVARALRDRAAHRRELIRVCGLAAVRALFARDPDRVERLFFAGDMQSALAPQCQALTRAHKPYRRVADDELARVAGTVLHGGVVAVARPQPVHALDPWLAAVWAQQGAPLLVLDGIGNPHNLGAIARSAAFFGLDRLILADRPEQA